MAASAPAGIVGPHRAESLWPAVTLGDFGLEWPWAILAWSGLGGFWPRVAWSVLEGFWPGVAWRDLGLE